MAQVRALSALHSIIMVILYFSGFLLSFFLFTFFHLSDEQQPELNKKIMENLRYSATNGGEGTYDVLYLSTFYGNVLIPRCFPGSLETNTLQSKK